MLVFRMRECGVLKVDFVFFFQWSIIYGDLCVI